MKNILVNWKTTLSGFVALCIAVYHCYQTGKLDLMCVYDAVIGVGLIASKDYNVSGGTVAQTSEAVSRVK